MTESTLDLRQLALERPSNLQNPRPRRWLSRFVLPGIILAGFVTLLGVAAGMQFLPVPGVTVVPVITKRGDIQKSGTVLFQTAGWIEPRPSSIAVSALTGGILEQLLVVGGQDVQKGETVAKLIATDAQLLVEQARATLTLREAELQRAIADQEAARLRLEQPVHLKAELGDAQNALAKTMTEIEKLPFLVRSAAAQSEFATKNLAGKQSASASLPELILQQAERDRQSALADLEELKARGPSLQKEADSLNTRVGALQQQMTLLIEERRRVAETTALVDSAKAQVQEARVRLQQAELTLSRTEIRAPINGRVLRLVAAPGTRVMGLEELAGQSSATILEMYDPKTLQVRADVRLEDVARIVPGAPVEIETPAAKGRLRGRVLLPTSSANVQKNTLEVKVELLDPPETVSPEMLVKASFLAPEVPGAAEEPTTQTEQLYVPRSLVTISVDQSTVWIVDGAQQARRTLITTGESTADGLIQVLSGLQVTDRVISTGAEQLTDGARVQIRSEDQTLGMRN